MNSLVYIFIQIGFVSIVVDVGKSQLLLVIKCNLCTSLVGVIMRNPELYGDIFLAPTRRNQQFGKSTKAKNNKYYKRSTKDDLVVRATLEAITRMG